MHTQTHTHTSTHATHTQTHTSTHTTHTHTQHTQLHLAAHTMINAIFSPHSSFTSLKQLVRAQTGVEEDYIELYFENLPLAPRPREMISLDRLPQTSVSALCNCAHNWMPCDNATISMGYATNSMGYATNSMGYATISMGYATNSMGYATNSMGYTTIRLL